MPCIKSVQRGTGSGNQTISINSIDASKSMVIITPGLSKTTEYSSNQVTRGVCTFALSNSALTITNASWGGGDYGTTSTYTWQIIEFA